MISIELKKHYTKYININNTLVSLLAILLNSKKNRIYARRNNDNCLVIVNGPSLKNDIHKIIEHSSHFDILCVNDFGTQDIYEIIKPYHYVFLDPYYWSDILPQKEDVKRNILYKKILSNTNWAINIYYPFEAMKSSTINKLINYNNKHLNINYYNRIPIDGTKIFRLYCYKKNYGLPSGQNVLIAAIYIPLNLGYKNIILFGADHSLHEHINIDSDNNVYIDQEHFYDKGTENRLPYSRSVVKSRPIKMFELFEIWHKAYKGYCYLEEYAEYLGAKVINSSSKSYIDAFERKKIEDILVLIK